MKYAILFAAAAAFGLAGCAEREQTAGGFKSDTHAFEGTNKPYVAAGWKPGDRGSWEQHMKVRTVRAQNEYVKVP